VAWTEKAPVPLGSTLRHDDAEGILRGPISVAYVELSQELAARAGAPPSWPDKWRCVAIVNDDMSDAGTAISVAYPGSALPRRP
jgi:hypothetical protein